MHRRGVKGRQYVYILFQRFHVYICIDLVKSGVLTLAGDTLHYRNNCYYH